MNCSLSTGVAYNLPSVQLVSGRRANRPPGINRTGGSRMVSMMSDTEKSKISIQDDIQVNFAQTAAEVVAGRCLELWKYRDNNSLPPGGIKVTFTTTVGTCTVKAEAELQEKEGWKFDVTASVDGASDDGRRQT